MNKGLVTAIAPFINEIIDDKAFEEDADKTDDPYELPPDISLAGHYASDSSTLDKALCRPNVKEWQKALDYEIGQLEKLGTWVVEDLLEGQTAIPCNKITQVKCGPDGQVQGYRVRIVAGDHRQVEGVDYTETFSVAAKMPTVCIVLANATHQDWEIEHINVKSAYLNAPSKEVIYMKPP
jgi:Reverse transcriptase (RNA-dependent DNA polymerase)